MKTTRNTAAKTAIASLLSESKVALSHIEIQHQLNGLCDRVTIYRVLDRLVNEDSIHKIATPEGTVKYASCHHTHTHDNHPHQHNHVHFHCEKCQSVTCLDAVIPQFEIPTAYVVKETNFTVTGICPKCQ
jgi:Fur family transcriptional regulator, ferric uptake regulator